MHRALSVSIPIIAFLTSGCSSTESVAHTRAANDFSCSKDLVDVKSIGGTSYRATGCGHVATYDCVEAASHGFLFFRRHSYMCVPEGQSVAFAFTSYAPKATSVSVAPRETQAPEAPDDSDPDANHR